MVALVLLVLLGLLVALVAAKRRLQRLSSAQDAARADKPWLLLVTAHPDDESMFFVPVLRAYDPARSFVLCLSNGGFDGLGKVRERELRACCGACFGLPTANVDVLDDARMQDGPSEAWAAADVAAVVRRKVAALVAQQRQAQAAVPALDVVTFDEGGVSGHANHVSVHRGVLRAVADVGVGSDYADVAAVRFWQLRSSGLLRKYAGALPVLLGASAPAVLAVNASMRLSYNAMAAHASQFVWYRKLFVVFSSYTFVNVLSPICCAPQMK